MSGAAHRAQAAAGTAGGFLFPAFVAFVLFAPLFKAGNRPLPLMALELAAVAFLFATLAVRRELPVLPRALVVALGIALLYPLLQYVPLPEAWWRHLPGHAEYIAAIDRFAGALVRQGSVDPARTISVIPADTEQGWLALLPPLAALLVVPQLRTEQVARLLGAMTALAAGEALLGLLQVGAGGAPYVFRPVEDSTGRGTAFGTFVDPDHFAAFLAMSLPLALGLSVQGLARRRGTARDDAGGDAAARRSRLQAQRMLLVAAAVMMLLCVVTTWSRAGIAAALLGLALWALLPRRWHGRRARWLVAGVLALAALLALLVGVAPVLDKLGASSLGSAWEGRWLMTATTLRAALEFLPFGSGLSTLDGVLPRFLTGAVTWGVDYAHNDYAQAFMELGMAAPAMIGAALWAYFVRMRQLLRAPGGDGFTALQLAAGIGIAPLLLHSAFDFSLHMPAIAVWTATLAGVVFHRADAHAGGAAPR